MCTHACVVCFCICQCGVYCKICIFHWYVCCEFDPSVARRWRTRQGGKNFGLRYNVVVSWSVLLQCTLTFILLKSLYLCYSFVYSATSHLLVVSVLSIWPIFRQDMHTCACVVCLYVCTFVRVECTAKVSIFCWCVCVCVCCEVDPSVYRRWRTRQGGKNFGLQYSVVV